jgi:AcrR family transcriptional regulator
MPSTQSDVPLVSTVSRRERKKIQTRRDLAAAARRLTREHGLDDVTVQQISDAIDVSPRTFFNYYTCKEEAIVGFDPSVLEELREALINRPAHEGPLTALRNAVLERGAATPDVAEGWTQRTVLVNRYPALLPSHLAALADVEHALVSALAERLRTDAYTDLTPHVIVACAVATLRTTHEWWVKGNRAVPLDKALAAAFDALVDNLDNSRLAIA